MDENNKDFTTVPPAGEQITFDQVPPVEIPPVEIPPVETEMPQAEPVQAEAPQVETPQQQNYQQVPPTPVAQTPQPQQQYYQQTPPPQQNYQQTPPPQNGYQVPPTSVMQEPDTEPMSFGDWLVTLLLTFIPCVNIIMLFVWAFGDKTGNLNRQNFAKAKLVFWGIGIALYAIIMIFWVVIMAASY